MGRYEYGEPEIGEVKATKGDKHDYIGMILDYSTKGEVKVDMRYYVKNMLKEFPIKLKSTDTTMTPANENLFNVDNSKNLDKKEQNSFTQQ